MSSGTSTLPGAGAVGFPRPAASTMRTEADVIAALAGRTVTVQEIYSRCTRAGVDLRDGGTDLVCDGQTRSRRRARGALQTLRRAGRATRVADGTWLIYGSLEKPRAMLLVIAGDVSTMELVLGDAERLLLEQDEPVDLVLTDPPWGLGINASGRPGHDNGERVYGRDPAHLVGGYVDVDPADYREFTERWVTAAAGVLKPGGYLPVVTGPGQAARVQVVAEDGAGLAFVGQLIVTRPFALPTSRRFSHAHSVVTVLSKGEVGRRFLSVPDELPRARSGRAYPLDVWDVGKHERRGQVRNPTMLHPAVPRRVVSALTPGPENGGNDCQSRVADPFVGGGETALACHRLRRRFVGGDVNPGALRLTAARLSTEAGPAKTHEFDAAADA